MILIRNKKFIFIGLLILLCVFFMRIGMSMSQDSQKKDSQTETRTLIIGVPKDSAEVLMKGLEKEEIYAQYLKQGRELFKKQEYGKALEVLLEGLSYADENKIHAWNLHWRLADVYEALGKKGEFLKEIDWLIEHSHSKKTTAQFIQRKETFLKNYNETKQ